MEITNHTTAAEELTGGGRISQMNHLLFLLLFTHHFFLTTSQPICPLNFTIIQKFLPSTNPTTPISTPTKCQYTLQLIHLLQSQLLKTKSLFLPTPDSSDSCWRSLTSFLSQPYPNFDPLLDCGFSPLWISQGCMNISTRAQFESVVPSTALADVGTNCNQSLVTKPPCASCTTVLGRIQASYLNEPDFRNNVTSCMSYPAIYAAGVVNPFGPVDDGTALCLFSLQSGSSNKDLGTSNKSSNWVIGVAIGVVVLFVVIVGFGIFFGLRKMRRGKTRRTRNESSILQLESSIQGHTTLVRYDFEEIKLATNGFSPGNIIGRGGFGNVFKGVLPDGTEVAVKRFKNCSSAGDQSFAHEVEMIASVGHVNLVPLRGYCIANTRFEGHHRMIICDLIKNGSLHDHLFGSPPANADRRNLTWPVRQKIAIGTARGLAYLHSGAQPAIIHRDIKASNILLDFDFDPKLADFGLAKFSPDGASHVSTRVAGTLGYVAPEYALFGKLTDKSDVYSFGVLLLEIISGKKAIVSKSGNETLLLTDWAWSLMTKGRAIDAVDDRIRDFGAEFLQEKYVRIGLLCSHPQLQARPAMDVVVKLLETDLEVPEIPDRPISFISDMTEIERSASSSGSGLFTSLADYQSLAAGNGHSPSSKEM